MFETGRGVPQNYTERRCDTAARRRRAPLRAWDKVFRTVALTDIDPPNLAEVAPVAAELTQELAADPRSILRFQRDGLYHVPAIGLSAGFGEDGFFDSTGTDPRSPATIGKHSRSSRLVFA
jgi:hypothetical protein